MKSADEVLGLPGIRGAVADMAARFDQLEREQGVIKARLDALEAVVGGDHLGALTSA